MPQGVHPVVIPVLVVVFVVRHHVHIVPYSIQEVATASTTSKTDRCSYHPVPQVDDWTCGGTGGRRVVAIEHQATVVVHDSMDAVDARCDCEVELASMHGLSEALIEQHCTSLSRAAMHGSVRVSYCNSCSYKFHCSETRLAICRCKDQYSLHWLSWHHWLASDQSDLLKTHLKWCDENRAGLGFRIELQTEPKNVTLLRQHGHPEHRLS